MTSKDMKRVLSSANLKDIALVLSLVGTGALNGVNKMTREGYRYYDVLL